MILRRLITSEEEWLSWRREALNASEIGACGGYYPYRSLAQIVVIKRGLDIGPDPLSPLLQRGHDLEETVARMLQRKFPRWQITKNNDYYVDTDRRMGATPDYFAVDPDRLGTGCVQIKVVAEPIFKRDWTEDSYPFWITLQVQQEMLLTGARWGVVAVLPFGGFTWDVKTYPMEPHAPAQARLIEMAEKFWADFDAGRDPEIDYARDSKLIDLLFPAAEPETIVDLTGDNEIDALLEELEREKKNKKDAEAAIMKADGRIKAKIGAHEKAAVRGWRLTWKEQHKKGFWTKPTSFRVLRATRINPQDVET
jgi:predicted phage-related endonuclease